MSSEGVNTPSVARTWLRALNLTAPTANNPTRILPELVQELAERFGAAPATLSERESWNFKQFAERANQYSRWALEQKIAPVDVVSLLMPNRPEYLAIWLGITAIGGVVSVVKIKLIGKSLAQCMGRLASADSIVAVELTEEFKA